MNITMILLTWLTMPNIQNDTYCYEHTDYLRKLLSIEKRVLPEMSLVKLSSMLWSRSAECESPEYVLLSWFPWSSTTSAELSDPDNCALWFLIITRPSEYPHNWVLWSSPKPRSWASVSSANPRNCDPGLAWASDAPVYTGDWSWYISSTSP